MTQSEIEVLEALKYRTGLPYVKGTFCTWYSRHEQSIKKLRNLNYISKEKSILTLTKKGQQAIEQIPMPQIIYEKIMRRIEAKSLEIENINQPKPGIGSRNKTKGETKWTKK